MLDDEPYNGSASGRLPQAWRDGGGEVLVSRYPEQPRSGGFSAWAPSVRASRGPKVEPGPPRQWQAQVNRRLELPPLDRRIVNRAVRCWNLLGSIAQAAFCPATMADAAAPVEGQVRHRCRADRVGARDRVASLDMPAFAGLEALASARSSEGSRKTSLPRCRVGAGCLAYRPRSTRAAQWRATWKPAFILRARARW
jgi:hypothetical protein